MIWLVIGGVSWVLLVVLICAFFAGAAALELPPCVEGCYLDLSTSVFRHAAGCPNQGGEG